MTTIILAADETYLRYVPCNIAQIARFGRRADGVVLAVPTGVDEELIAMVRSAATAHGLELEVATVSELEPLHKDRVISGVEHISYFTYSKLLFAEILPELDDVLYLDVDTLVRAPLDDLLAWKLHHPVGGVHDWATGAHLFGTPSRPYFNAGVLRLSLRRMRQEQTWIKAQQIFQTRDLKIVDQDVFNLLFGDRFDSLPPTFNVFDSLVPRRLKIAQDPVIVHFAGPDKPWLRSARSQFAQEWRRWYSQAGYASYLDQAQPSSRPSPYGQARNAGKGRLGSAARAVLPDRAKSAARKAADKITDRTLCRLEEIKAARNFPPINMGNPHEMSILEVAELVRDLTGSGSVVQFTARPQDDPSQRQPDITLARSALQWEPRVNVRDGLSETIEWFRHRRDTEAQPVDDVEPRYRVAVVGTGYVGAVTATCMAFLGYSVVGLDNDSVRTGQLNTGHVPFIEPGLPEMLKAALSTGRLTFTDRPEQALEDADFVILCVGTPPGPNGSPDLTQLENAVQSMGPFLRPEVVVVNKSTVPVGSGNWIRTALADAVQRGCQQSFHVVSNPEFLREGSAIADFLYPDRIVLGGADEDVSRVAALFQPVLDQSFEGARAGFRPVLITTEMSSAEMIKYAANAFLATKISFANEMARLCEFFGADAREVLPAVGADARIGVSFLSPGIGWGGSCLGKDVAALVASGQEFGYTPPMLRATVEINEMQRARAVRKLQQELHIIKGRRIAVLGLTFKPGTDDLRDAPALDIVRRLLAGGAVVSAFDPVITSLPKGFEAVRLTRDAYEAADRVDAVLVATEWPELRLIDPAELRRVMTGNLVVDGRNCLPEARFKESGLRLVGFGW